MRTELWVNKAPVGPGHSSRYLIRHKTPPPSSSRLHSPIRTHRLQSASLWHSSAYHSGPILDIPPLWGLHPAAQKAKFRELAEDLAVKLRSFEVVELPIYEGTDPVCPVLDQAQVQLLSQELLKLVWRRLLQAEGTQIVDCQYQTRSISRMPQKIKRMRAA